MTPLTLTSAHILNFTKNAPSVITSSSQHLNGHQIADRAATQAGLAYRVMGLVCERSADRIPDEAI